MSKLCPLLATTSNSHMPCFCQESNCVWWREYVNDCAIPLMADMFADSDMCKTVFKVQHNEA